MPVVAPSDNAIAMEQHIPTSAQRPQMLIGPTFDVHTETDQLQLVGRVSGPGERAEFLRGPAGSHSQFVEQDAQEAVQLAQAIADDPGLIASLDGHASRMAKAGTEEAGSIQQGPMRLFDADGQKITGGMQGSGFHGQPFSLVKD